MLGQRQRKQHANYKNHKGMQTCMTNFIRKKYIPLKFDSNNYFSMNILLISLILKDSGWIKKYC